MGLLSADGPPLASDEAELGLGGDGVDYAEDDGALVVGEVSKVGEPGAEEKAVMQPWQESFTPVHGAADWNSI